MQSRRAFLTRLGVATTIGATGLATTRQALGTTPSPSEANTAKSGSDKPEFIQPDYAAWAQIQENMTEADVLHLLGEPIERRKPPEKGPFDDGSVIRVYSWVYGRIDFKSSSVPWPDEFCVMFGNGRVLEKDNPFDAPLSTDGKPSVPRLIYPLPHATYQHYPRYLDLRWQPSSGQYPMHYLVERQTGNDVFVERDGATVKERQWYQAMSFRVDIPYLLILFGGKNAGRWRVKAVNTLGESDWSEYRDFKFEV